MDKARLMALLSKALQGVLTLVIRNPLSAKRQPAYSLEKEFSFQHVRS